MNLDPDTHRTLREMASKIENGLIRVARAIALHAVHDPTGVHVRNPSDVDHDMRKVKEFIG